MPLYKPYLWHIEKSAVDHSGIRMGLSALNLQRKSFTFIENGFCSHCQNINEDTTHYMLECPNYAAQRERMLRDLNDHITVTGKSKQKLAKLLLFGTGLVEIDNKIFPILQTYITQTSRFHVT